MTPDAVVIAALKSDGTINTAAGGRISTDMRPGATCLRVTLIGGMEPSAEWWSAQVQVECWATDQIAAGQLAALVRQRWPQLRGDFAGAHMVGGWVETDPVWLPDPDSDRPRYMLTVGLTLG